MSHKLANVDWAVANQAGDAPDWQRVEIAVLMDIRAELRMLNAHLRCPNFVQIPTILRGIRRNTAKPRKAKSGR